MLDPVWVRNQSGGWLPAGELGMGAVLHLFPLDGAWGYCILTLTTMSRHRPVALRAGRVE
jgi:hypothetical protein